MDLSFFKKSRAGFSTSLSFSTEGIQSLKQTHSAQGGWAHLNPPVEGDWLATTKPRQRLGIKVADCTALLIEGIGEDGPFCAGIHAGWRGTAAGVIESCWNAVKPLEATRVWLSPSICGEHFEVGDEVLKALGQDSMDWAKPLTQPRKFLLDLKRLQIQKIERLSGGRAVIAHSTLCTYCQPDFFSYRRAKAQLKPGERHWSWIELL